MLSGVSQFYTESYSTSAYVTEFIVFIIVDLG